MACAVKQGLCLVRVAPPALLQWEKMLTFSKQFQCREGNKFCIELFALQLVMENVQSFHREHKMFKSQGH